MQTHFGWIDAGIIIAYLVVLASVGFYFSRRQKNLEMYFLAGRGMSWLPVGLSLMACLNSGIDYIMGPSSTIRYGLLVVTSAASWFLLWPWVRKVTLPFYRRLQVYTAYEYLERRFDGRVRTLAASIFLLWRIGWIATAMYVPCLAIYSVTGHKLPIAPTVIALGSVVTLYTVLGGMKAVIWTDIIQFFIMFGGLAITVFLVVSKVPGGFGEIWSRAFTADKLSFAMHLPSPAGTSIWNTIVVFFREYTWLGIFIAAMVGRLTAYTCDQVMVQRFQTTKSLKDSRQAFIINAVGDVIWTLGLALVGLALFAYLEIHGRSAGVINDELFPRFMAEQFPTGLIGLVIAAIFAASLGATGSAINSCTSVVIVDFYERLFRKKTDEADGIVTERQRVRISKIAALLVGIVAVVVSVNVGSLGDLIEIANKVIQIFTGPLFAIYVLGMFTVRARSSGVLAGGLAGTLTAVYVAFFREDICFLFPTVFGFAAALFVGYVASLTLNVFQGAPDPKHALLTFRNVMKLPEPSSDQRKALAE